MDDETTTGAAAHAAGEPISACPYAPGDPAGAEWRADWIEAEATARTMSGTFGASDDDYHQAGLKPPQRTLSYDDVVKAFLGSGTPMGVVVGRATAHFFIAPGGQGIQVVSTPGIQGHHWIPLDAFLDEAQTLTDVFADLPDPSPAPAGPTARHRPCPRHGPTTSGLCRACARGR